MLGKKDTCESSSMVMVSKTTLSNFCTFWAVEQAEKYKLHCNQYNGTCHIKDTCFEIHNYPEWFLEKWKPKKKKKTRNNRGPAQSKVANAIDTILGVAAMTTCQNEILNQVNYSF